MVSAPLDYSQTCKMKNNELSTVNVKLVMRNAFVKPELDKGLKRDGER